MKADAGPVEGIADTASLAGSAADLAQGVRRRAEQHPGVCTPPARSGWFLTLVAKGSG